MGALNMNMNMNMAAGILSGSGGSPTRVRYNSQDWWKYINVGDLLVPGSPGSMKFPANWDADLRSYIYLAEFLNTPGMGGVPAWQAKVDLELGPPGSAAPRPKPRDSDSRHPDRGARPGG